MIVQKYGGSSVATLEKIAGIAKSIKKRLKREEKMVVVVSAMSGETDKFIALAEQAFGAVSGREVDQLVSQGENKTIALLSMALKKLGVKAVSLTGWQAGIITTDDFSTARINKIKVQNIKEKLEENDVVVVAGFQGVTLNGNVTTLGKGGSDTTAVALGAAFKCKCEIFTDVCGVYSLDPHIYKNAKKLDEISYDELMEMASNGAKVMEPRSVLIAKKYGVELFISQSLKPSEKGTIVKEKTENFESMSVKNITVKEDVCLVKINALNSEAVGNVVRLLKRYPQNLENFNICNSGAESELVCILDKKNKARFLAEVKKLEDVEVVSAKTFTKITLVGSGFRTQKWILEDVLNMLSNCKISPQNLLLSEISLSFMVKPSKKNLAVNALSEKFELCEKNGLSLAIVGATGLVGQTFLKILAERDIKKEIDKIYVFASAKSAGKVIDFCGKKLVVEELCPKNITNKKIDYAFFSVGEKLSKEFAPIFAKNGIVVIDNSSAFRMDENVPLIVPEVNFKLNNSKIIANPNCSTIQAVVPLGALQKAFGIKKIAYATYQAVSGSGQKGVEDLTSSRNGELPKFYPRPIYNNCLPHIGSFGENGFTSEEMKMINETRKILQDETLPISATCVRVPVENCHAVLVSAWLKKPASRAEVVSVLESADGVQIMDETAKDVYPINEDASGKDAVLVGRIRKDLFEDNLVHFWCVADNVRKGAALNGVQILEKIVLAYKK